MADFRRLPPLPVVLALAFAARLAVAFAFPNTVAPDEVFQFLEQAHRLVFGAGLVPWEFQIGLRNWAIPLLLAGPMALARLVDPDPTFGLALLRVLLCAASLSVVAAAALWGGRLFGQRGVWAAGGVAAFWPDLVLMAPHPLEETLAAYALVPALYLADLPRRGGSAWRLGWTGLLLGLAFTFRIQLAPAIALAGLILCGGDGRRWRFALSAAALPVLAAGLLDWLTWGQPFRSFWLNIYVNVFLHVAKNVFGHDPASFLPLALLLDWLWALPFVLLLLWRGAWRLPVPAATAGVILLTHALIAHKEFRFIFPALALLVPVAGVGLAELCAMRPRLWLYGAWLSGLAFSPLNAMLLNDQTRAHRLFASLAAARPCVVSLQDWDQKFVPQPQLFGARTRFTDRTINAGVEADVVVASPGATAMPPDLTLRSCVPGNWIPFKTPPNPQVCAWTRPAASCPAGEVEPFQFVFPAAARRFLIRDRLFG